jgi:hypothetical protein
LLSLSTNTVCESSPQYARALSAKEHYLGPVPRKTKPSTAEAEALDMDVMSFHRATVELAGLTYYGSRAYISSYCARLSLAITEKRIDPICSATFVCYDESTFILRVKHFMGARQFDDLDRLHKVNRELRALANANPQGAQSEAARAAAANNQKSLCKITQSDAAVLFAFQCLVSKEIYIIQMPLIVPLQVSDHCTAETNLAFMQEQLYVRGLAELRAKFKHNFDLSCHDAGSANVKMELFAEDLSIFPRLSSDCEGHRVHTVQGKVYDVMNNTISNFIAFALAQTSAGAVDKLRNEIKIVLRSSVTHACAAPPKATDPRSVVRDALLDLCVDDPVRKFKLEVLITSATGEHDIIYYSPLKAVDVDLDKWADELSWLLLPRKTKLFRRQRWVSSLSSVKEGVLLANVFAVLERAGGRWINVLQGKTPGRMPTAPITWGY